MSPRPAAFLLFRLKADGYKFVSGLRESPRVLWAAPVYGPYQAVAYAEGADQRALTTWIESLRELPGVIDLDARAVKPLPEDPPLGGFRVSGPERSVLLIGVDYREERERVVTLKLRDIPGVVMARAMWGPADIIAIVEAPDHEAMRNLICDGIKVLAGVRSNTTLYCYPDSD
jgi:DNA-binding Lrp family transcriptional regulator